MRHLLLAITHALGILCFGLCFTSMAKANCIILIRHGEAEQNVKKIFNGDLLLSRKFSLTPLGRVEVSKAGTELREKFHYDDSKIEAVYVSPFLRTRETATILASELRISSEKVMVEDLLSESGMGRMEGQSTENFPYGKSSWDHTRAHEYGGETDEDVRKRMKLFLDSFKKKGHKKDVLVVTHGTPARELDLLIRGDSTVPQFNKAEFRILCLGSQKGDL